MRSIIVLIILSFLMVGCFAQPVREEISPLVDGKYVDDLPDVANEEWQVDDAERLDDYDDYPWVERIKATEDYYKQLLGEDTEESGSLVDGCPNGCTSHKSGCDIKGNISFN